LAALFFGNQENANFSERSSKMSVDIFRRNLLSRLRPVRKTTFRNFALSKTSSLTTKKQAREKVVSADQKRYTMLLRFGRRPSLAKYKDSRTRREKGNLASTS